jgi:RHS repeat-associated protein
MSAGACFWSADPPQVSIDPNGNLTHKTEGNETWTYEWDAEDRLTRALKNAVEQARFAYDPLGRRVEKVAGGVTTAWTYDGEDALRQTSGSAVLKYVDGAGIDEPLAQEDGSGALTFFHADALGSILKTTNSAGAVTASLGYTAFGRPEFGMTDGYAFTGREWDNETGLYYYRARYYDPKIGRFISEDPIRFLGGFNFYTYVGNKAASRVDPFGLKEYPNTFMGPLPPDGYYTSQMTKTSCGLIPPAPPRTPPPDVRRNMREAAGHINPWWYYDQVKNKGPWDYKQDGQMYEDFGNFNFGATCKAFGFPEETCLREAGRGQRAAGTSRPDFGDPGSRLNPWGGTPPYGDDPADQAMIKRGMAACRCLMSRSY